MNKKIPYGLHDILEEDIEAVVEVLRKGPITQGQQVECFGRMLSEYAGAKFGVVVSSGTAALHLAMAAIGIGPGDEVITTPMTFCATANVALYQGASVRFVDIDGRTLNIDPELIESAITERTKAIVPVDFRGHPASLPRIKGIADRYSLKTIEDGSHSLGSRYRFSGQEFKCGDGRHADMCTFSFHPVKHITTGEGGAILTGDRDLYARLKILKKHGIDRRDDMFSEADRIGPWKYDMESLGFNYRITDFQAALGMSQLRRIEALRRRRREIVNYYNAHLIDFEELVLPFEHPDVDSNFHLYVLQVRENPHFDRYDLFLHLQEKGYLPMVHYIPVHLLSYYRKRFGFKRGDFPVAEGYYDRTISIPLYPALTDAEVEKVVNDIAAFIRR